jgi:hypothetical protein
MNENIREVETLIPTVWPDVSFAGKFSPNPDLKNMISTNRKDFPLKKWPKFAHFAQMGLLWLKKYCKKINPSGPSTFLGSLENTKFHSLH